MNRDALRTPLTVILAALAILAAGAGAFQSAMAIKIPKVEISGAWARVGLEGGNSAAYFTIVSKEEHSLTLIKAESDAATATELHKTAIDADGVMRMAPVPSVELPAKAAAHFQPGGLHVMLIGLEKPLHEGDEILLRLIFDGYDPVSIAVPVLHGSGDGDHDHH